MIRYLPPILLAGAWISVANADAIFNQAPTGDGTLLASSWAEPDGTDSDMYAYESFILPSSAPINEVRWRGGYIHGKLYSGPVWNFTITFFESIPGGTQPHVGNPQLPEIYLAKYTVGGNAGETLAGSFGGIPMYDYSYVLPTPFQAQAGVKYWIRIEASQVGQPDWGIAAGTGGDSHHFVFSTGAARFFWLSGDPSFSLHAPPGPYFAVATVASPSNAGTTTGGGLFTNGTSVSIHAVPNAGYAFSNWTTNGSQASASANYSFTVDADQVLVANFLPAFGITTAASPPTGGATAGDGNYPYGAPVVVSATPEPNFKFVNWTENGAPVSAAADYQFNASGDRALTANFVQAQSNTIKVFDRPHDNSGTVIKSAWYPPDGLDGDQYVFDNFSFATNQAITEVRWRGGYSNYRSGAGKSPVYDFTVAIYGSVAVGSEPDRGAQPLVRYTVGGNANETLAGTFGGTEMYDYLFVLPVAFSAIAGSNYWLQIEAWQGLTPIYYWPPDWGFAAGSGGDAHHFQTISGGPSGTYSGDASFSLFGPGSGFSVNAIASPDIGGTVGGGGVFTNGAYTTLTAVPAGGYLFVSWNEDGIPISASASYGITVTNHRTVVASFAQPFSIGVSPQPADGGTVSGGGACLGGSNVLLVATANAGYRFVEWTEGGFPVSTENRYYFIADASRELVANFVSTHTILTGVAPPGSGIATGGGVFVEGAPVTLVPTPAAGHAFVNWSEGGIPVCNWPSYAFTAMTNRSLVANFAPAYAIVTGASSTNGGTTSGGMYAGGTEAIAMAIPDTGYAFVDWTEGGTSVSASASYGFAATADRSLVAHFTQDVTSVTFDFDTAMPALTTNQATPFGQAVSDLTAELASPAGPPYSIQSDQNLGWMMPRFSKKYLYPGGAGGSLQIRFNQLLRAVTLTFATLDSQDIVTPSIVQVTAYRDLADGAPVGIVTGSGTYNPGDPMPMGSVRLDAGRPFNIVVIQCAAGFAVDNIVASTIPRLKVDRPAADQVVLAWPSATPGWVLQESPDLTAWSDAARSLNVVSNENQIILSPLMPRGFFRLNHP